MKKLFHFAFLAIILGSFAVQAETVNTAEKPYKEVTAEEVQNILANDTQAVLLDTRGEKYIKGIIIKGAKVLSNDKINEASLAEVAPSKTAPLILYCQNPECPASSKAAYKAKEYGYNDILKYTGGIEDWVEKKLPTETITK